MGTTSFSAVTARVCTVTGKTVIKAAHSGAAAARPQLSATVKTPSTRLPLPAHRFLRASTQPAQPAAAAICTMGARGGRLRESLELRIRAESGATLMVDSSTAVRLSPASPPGTEYGIGIHAGVESGALLVITPDAHVPCREAHAGLWTRYDLSPSASLVSVQLADLNAQAEMPPEVGGRYSARTRVHHTYASSYSHGEARAGWHDPLGEGFSADPAGWCDPLDDLGWCDPLAQIGDSRARTSLSSCGLPFAAKPSWSCDWTYGRRFQGLVMGTPTTNVIATVVMAGPRAEAVVRSFKEIEGGEAAHCSLGLLGQAHLAVQEVRVRTGALVVARLGAEHREDMHRLLHHALRPLEAQLGIAPYARRLLASRTVATARSFAGPRQFRAKQAPP